MTKIVNKNNPGLRIEAKPVDPTWFGQDKLKKIVAKMSRALAEQDDGVALAAPQIALSLRLFIVSGKVLTDNQGKKIANDLIFINPKLTKLSKTKKMVEEGCLSVRWFYGRVKRSTKATIEAYDLAGKKFTYSGSGLMAQIFQHEMDHLSGVLFTDKAEELQEFHPKENSVV